MVSHGLAFPATQRSARSGYYCSTSSNLVRRPDEVRPVLSRRGSLRKGGF
jgi:hypothetical protein